MNKTQYAEYEQEIRALIPDTNDRLVYVVVESRDKVFVRSLGPFESFEEASTLCKSTS
jgi:hypothetical protein